MLKEYNVITLDGTATVVAENKRQAWLAAESTFTPANVLDIVFRRAIT